MERGKIFILLWKKRNNDYLEYEVVVIVTKRVREQETFG